MFKLLVVEDDRELNKTVCSYLNQNGYEAVGCLSANEAYDAMYGGTLFDLIVSDIMMPEIDGFEFARTVRELNQENPYLVYDGTGRSSHLSSEVSRLGIDDYMVKPIDLDELLLRVEALAAKGENCHQQKADGGEPDTGRGGAYRLSAMEKRSR